MSFVFKQVWIFKNPVMDSKILREREFENFDHWINLTIQQLQYNRIDLLTINKL